MDILAETLLPEAAAVDAELSKLQLLAGGKPLTQEQARSVSPTTEFNVFAFLRQLQAGQTASVWKSILEEQAKGEEPLFYLLAMLQREARQLWQILAGEQVRMGPSDQQAKQQTASRLGAAGSPSSGTPCTPPNFPSNREGAPPARRWMPSWAI